MWTSRTPLTAELMILPDTRHHRPIVSRLGELSTTRWRGLSAPWWPLLTSWCSVTKPHSPRTQVSTFSGQCDCPWENGSQARIQDFLKGVGGGGGWPQGGGGVIGGDRPCRRKITIWTIFSYKRGDDHPYPPPVSATGSVYKIHVIMEDLSIKRYLWIPKGGQQL